MQLFPPGAEFDLPSRSRVKVIHHCPGLEVECRYVWTVFDPLPGRGRCWQIALDPEWLYKYGRKV